MIKLQWLEHRWYVYHGWFELVSESLGNSYDSSRKQIFRDSFGSFSYEHVYCAYSVKLAQWGDTNDTPQHTILAH